MVCIFHKQVEYESARRKEHVIEKPRKGEEQISTLPSFPLISLCRCRLKEVKIGQNPRELKSSSKQFMGSPRRSNRKKRIHKWEKNSAHVFGFHWLRAMEVVVPKFSVGKSFPGLRN